MKEASPLISYFAKTRQMSYENIGPEKFHELMQGENSMVIDVRPEDELIEGEIEGHVTINFFDPSFQDEIDKLDRDRTYLLHCRSGNRSGKACAMMSQMGFEKLYNLDGGIQAWNSFKLG